MFNKKALVLSLIAGAILISASLPSFALTPKVSAQVSLAPTAALSSACLSCGGSGGGF